MRNKLAPLAMLFGLLTALLLGSTAAAQAGAADYKCKNTGVNIVTCNSILNDVDVTIKGNRVLTAEELVKVANVLNKTTVTIKDIDAAVVKVYESFNPKIIINVDDVQVCILAICEN